MKWAYLFHVMISLDGGITHEYRGWYEIPGFDSEAACEVGAPISLYHRVLKIYPGSRVTSGGCFNEKA